jgi:hypothetical protein
MAKSSCRDDDPSVLAAAVRNHLHSSLRTRFSGGRANLAIEEFPAHRTDSASCQRARSLATRQDVLYEEAGGRSDRDPRFP